MSKFTIDISELRSVADESVKDLAELLEGKTSAKVDVAGGEILLNYEEEKEVSSKRYLRVLLRKFLHRAELKEELRVISGRENVLIMKKRKM